MVFKPPLKDPVGLELLLGCETFTSNIGGGSRSFPRLQSGLPDKPQQQNVPIRRRHHETHSFTTLPAVLPLLLAYIPRNHRQRQAAGPGPHC
jgi:hypothetical protein